MWRNDSSCSPSLRRSGLKISSPPEGRDCLEAFVGKFPRMQDTLIDKLLPHCLAAVGEKTGSALDNLNRADRLGLLSNTDQWLAMRHLRNRLDHESVETRQTLWPSSIWPVAWPMNC